MCYIKGFIRRNINIAFTLNYSTDISLKCCKASASVQFSSVQFSCSVLSDSLRPQWIAARQASLCITNSQSSLRLASIESVIPSSHLILCPLLLPPIPPSIKVFSNESALHMRWPKWRAETKRKKEFNLLQGKKSTSLEAWEKETSNTITLKNNNEKAEKYCTNEGTT